MPSRRDQIAMTPDEIRAYLEEQRKVVIVTNGVNGLPHPVPMHYGIDEHGHILITTFRKSQKIRNLERDPRATLLIESGTRYKELKSVIAYCDAVIISDADSVASLMRKVRTEEVMADSISQPMTHQVRASVSKRVVVQFSPFRIVSWDHGKLGEFY